MQEMFLGALCKKRDDINLVQIMAMYVQTTV